MSARLPPDFGTLLRRYRAERELSQEELGERARLSAAAISALERGVRRAPYRETVALLAAALSLDDAALGEFTAAAKRARHRGPRSANDLQSVKIFTSYSPRDDEPGGAHNRGFVTRVHEHLRYVCRRRHSLLPSFATAIDEADVLLVVLSADWLANEGCLRDAERFADRFAAGAGRCDRIAVAATCYVPPEDRPSSLTGTNEYEFFQRETGMAAAAHPDFVRIVEMLAGGIAAALQSNSLHDDGVSRPKGAGFGHTIYLAKPAADMRSAYFRLYDELTLRGHTVFPERNVEIPNDGAAAVRCIDEALGRANVSLHLLGENAGFSPEDCEPVVRLQLARARESQRHRRIVWAPRLFVERDGSAARAVRRDPLAVLERFDRQVPSDTVDGSELPRFVDFVIDAVDALDAAPVSATSPAEFETESRVYIFHKEDDAEYALQIALALEQCEVEPVFPVFEGDPVEVHGWERKQLRDCDAVLVCWANAPEVWVAAQSEQLRSWRGLGRVRPFYCRTLVTGPPPGRRKSFRVAVPPRKQFDVVLDLTQFDSPPPRALDPLIDTLRDAVNRRGQSA